MSAELAALRQQADTLRHAGEWPAAAAAYAAVLQLAPDDSAVARIDEEAQAFAIRIGCLDDIRLPIEARTRNVRESAVTEAPHDSTGREKEIRLVSVLRLSDARSPKRQDTRRQTAE